MIAPEILSDAARNVAPGPPSSLGESLRSAFNLAKEAETGAGGYFALRDTYSRYLDEVETITGESFRNPLDAGAPLGDLSTAFAHEAARSRAEAEIFERVRKLREKFPDLPLRSPEDIRAEVGKKRASLREKRAEVERRETGFASVAGFMGTAAGVMTDPPVLGSMAFGAGAARGVLQGALIDAGINVGVETLQQGIVQGTRTQFGEKQDLGEAATAVAGAGVGGFILSGLLRGAGKAARPAGRAIAERVRALRNKPSEVIDAESFVSRQADMEQATPFDDTPAGRAEHVERFDEAVLAQRESRPARMRDKPVNPVRRDVVEAETAPSAAVEYMPPAERAVAEIGSQIRREAIESIRDDERLRAAITSAAGVADDERAFANFVQQIRNPPKPDGRRLLTALHRAGGLREEAGELRHMGITPKSRPGLIRTTGMTFDEAGEWAAERGYFTERPTVAELLDAVRDDFEGRPVFAEAEARAQMEEARQLGEFGAALSDAGVDVYRLKPEEARQKVRALAEGLTQESGMRMSQARADFVDIEERLAIQQEADAVLETQVRRLYDGREDEALTFETEDGFQRMTARKLFEEFERDADNFEALKVCIGGGR